MKGRAGEVLLAALQGCDSAEEVGWLALRLRSESTCLVVYFIMHRIQREVRKLTDRICQGYRITDPGLGTTRYGRFCGSLL